MSGCVEIINQNDIISRMNMTAAMFTSIGHKKRVNNMMMDGEFKMPLPKRRNNYQSETNSSSLMTVKQAIAAKIAAKRLV
jgi:hypothetical protein